MGLKRRPVQRRRLKSRGSKAKRDANRERNFGAKGGEADRVRAMPCLCAKHSADWYFYDLERCHAAGEPDAFEHNDPERPACSGSIVAAHVTARGMGGAKGGRFDLVPLCDGHHREAGEATRPGQPSECRVCGGGGELPSGSMWPRPPGNPLPMDPCVTCRGTGHALSKRAAFEARYGLKLRVKADEIALEHPDGLGIRGLAARFSWWARFDSQPPGLSCEQGDEWAEGQSEWLDRNESPDRLEGYDLEALLGRVRRRIDRSTAETRDHDYIRGAALLAVAHDLGLSLVVAETLCETAGWPS